MSKWAVTVTTRRGVPHPRGRVDKWVRIVETKDSMDAVTEALASIDLEPRKAYLGEEICVEAERVK